MGELTSSSGGPEFACELIADGDPVRVVLRGEFDLASVPVFDAAITGQAPRDRAIVVDLRALTFIDSRGIHALLRLHAGAGPRLSLIPGPAPVHRAFALAGLSAALPFRT